MSLIGGVTVFICYVRDHNKAAVVAIDNELLIHLARVVEWHEGCV